MGEKQVCDLASIIFNLFIVDRTLVFHRDLQLSDSVGVEYRLDGDLFKLRRLQAKTKTSSVVVFDLQYADDTAFSSLTADGLDLSFDTITETYLHSGHIVNIAKTAVLSASSPNAPSLSIGGKQLKNSEKFIYLGSNL